jgi:hypothetical protein
VLYVAIRILRNDPRHGLRNFVYAGLTLGVALAFRFPLVIFILLPLIAAWHSSKENRIRARLRSLLDRRIMTTRYDDGNRKAFLLASRQGARHHVVAKAGFVDYRQRA